jgi:CubicO group peptidase (beta-lactamase class C family)
MKHLFRGIRNTVIVLVALAVALTGFTRFIHYPNPIAAIKLGLAPASKTPTLMPWHTIQPATTPIVWPTSTEKIPETISWQGSTVKWQQFLDKSHTNAFILIRNGVITYEYYKKGITPETQLPSYSVAKTMTSIVIGQLVAAGKISEADTFVKYFPQLKTGTSFDQVTIQTLLDMQAGVGVSDNYPTGPQGWGVGIAQMYATTDMNWFIKHNRKMAFEPGSKSEYLSVDTQLLGMIIKNVTGDNVSNYFSKHVWQPIGAQYPATWNVDHIGGQEKTFCCFNAAARDYARVGLALINGGYAGSNQIISADWLKRMTTSVTTLDHDWGYGAQTWHPYPGITSAMGLHGQWIFTDPKTRTVIVKFSDNPTGNDPEVDTAKVLYDLAQKVN